MDSRSTVRALFTLFLAVVSVGAIVVSTVQFIMISRGDQKRHEGGQSENTYTWVRVGGEGFMGITLLRWVDSSGLVCYLDNYGGTGISCACPCGAQCFEANLAAPTATFPYVSP